MTPADQASIDAAIEPIAAVLALAGTETEPTDDQIKAALDAALKLTVGGLVSLARIANAVEALADAAQPRSPTE